MTIDILQAYCLNKAQVTEGFPFDQDTLVFKVAGKIFGIMPLEKWEQGLATISLKCDPEYALELRAEYSSIEGAWHLNKKHWNALDLSKGEIKPELVKKLIDHSYALVVQSLPKKTRDTFS